MAAAEHQIKIIGRCGGADSLFQRTQHSILPVVHQHHDVGQFQRRGAPDDHPGRKPVLHGGLGGPDSRAVPGSEIILLQIQRPHQTPADPAVRLLPLQVDEAVSMALKKIIVQILFHGPGDPLVRTGGPVCPQPGLR